MGCDIHLYTERKYNRDNQKPIWICCDHFKLNPSYILYPEEGYEHEWEIEEIYNGRNYSLFAALADVRNYDNIIPLATPRDLPDDVSRKVYEESMKWGSDGHSHSWFTARELFEYQKTHPTTRHEGMLEPCILKAFDEEGKIPTEWCQWTNIKGAERRSWETPGSPIDPLVKAVKKRMAEEFWIWDFLDEEKKEEAYLEHADEFRIVFWFDN